MRHSTTIAFGATAAVIVIMAFFTTWYTVDAGERGVMTRTGAYAGTAEPGLHFKLPFVEDVTHVSIQQQSTVWACYAGQNCPDGYLGVMQSYSRDQQPADLRVSVLWHALPDRMEQIYEQYGGDLRAVSDRLLGRKAPQAVKTVFGQFNAARVVQERAAFNEAVDAAVREAIDADAPIVVDGVQVENIDFSEAYEQSIEARMLAEVEVARRTQNLETEKIAATIAVTQAQGRADSQLAEATAKAEAVKIAGDAEAHAIRVKGEANGARIAAENEGRMKSIRENPAIIEYLKVSLWNGQLPTTMLPGGTLPMINLTPDQQQAAR